MGQMLSHVYYHTSDTVVTRQICDEIILVPLFRNVEDVDCIYGMNETAAFIWSLLDGQHSLKSIRDEMVASFDIDNQTAESDLCELIAQYESLKFIERVEKN